MNIPLTASKRRGRLARFAAATLGFALVAGSATAMVAGAQAATVNLIDTASSTWKYSDNNTDPAAGDADRLVWTKDGFDDSAWKSGKGSFGAKSGKTTGFSGGFVANTLLNQYISGTAAPNVATYHFRNSFELSGDQLSGIAGLSGTVVYDDAAQVFVNGIQVAGYQDERVVAASDAERNLTYAGNGKDAPLTSTFTVPVTALKSGVNTIAVAVYQDRDTSSDIYFDMKSLTTVDQSALAPTDLVLGVGGDETERNLAWYSKSNSAQTAQLARTSEVVDGTFPSSAVTVNATSGGLTTSGEYNYFATLSGLEENTSYSYRVGSDSSGWSTVQTFETQSFNGAFDFLFFGDPQIGASGNVANDGAGWLDTLNVAEQAYPDAALLFSAGDQVNTASSEAEYDAFLAPEQIREIPVVPTNGNHDVGSKAYEQHFNTPNTDRTAGAGSTTSSGGDYWFIYNDVLFMNINSNSRDYASHFPWMEQVVAEQGANAKWKVLAFHHSIYSVGPHWDDSDNYDRRANMPEKISELGVDVVLQGHDHSYARSFLMDGEGNKADPEEVAGAESVVAGPGGVLYVTANSASGSKYYSLDGKDQPWVSVYNQENVRNYSAVEVTDSAITIKTMRSQAFGTDNPVNSVVDQVTLTRENQGTDSSQELQVTVPEAASGEFIWSIDGSNDLVDLGTAEENGDHYAATGEINPIRVTDTRSSSPEWTISAQVGDFTSGSESFSGKYLGWTPKVLEEGGGAVAGESVQSGFISGDGLSVARLLGDAAAGHDRGSARLGADLDLKIPVDVTNGTYKAMLTLTALS